MHNSTKSFKAVAGGKLLVIAFLVLLTGGVQGQGERAARITGFYDATATTGNSEAAFSVSRVVNWRLGKSRKFETGIGLRGTLYTGNNKEFYTAPARLARSTTFPFLIVLAGQREANFDTLNVRKPLLFSENVTANFGYRFSSRWYGGFNIDLIGFTLGKKSSALLTSDGHTTTEPVAKPNAFNLLLTGDNDRGSLNSEFFVRYKLSRHWNLKAVYEFLFVEYQTTTIHQVAPDGTIVTRFRDKSNQLGLGVSYTLN